jgi:hypothetical protein
MRTSLIAGFSGLVLTLAACTQGQDLRVEPDLPEGGISVNRLLSGEAFASAGEFPVNSLLWKASLETLDFLPMSSTDPFSGIIATDWGALAGAADERFRVTIYIRSEALAVDSLRVAMFREVNEDGRWVAAPVSPLTVRQLEDAILLRARELRIAEEA